MHLVDARRKVRVGTCLVDYHAFLPEYAFKSDIALKANYFPPTNIPTRCFGQAAMCQNAAFAQKEVNKEVFA
jgi:hypothetical protein